MSSTWSECVKFWELAEVVIIRGASYRAQGRARLTEEVPTAQKQP